MKNIELWNDCFENMNEEEYLNKSIYELEDIFKDWLQEKTLECKQIKSKAEAYGRLMSGGKKTLKEWANLLGMNVAVEQDYWSANKLRGIASERKLCLKKRETIYGSSFLWANEVRGHQYEIPFHLIDYTGSWQDSLTLPDGWEEK